MRSRRGHLELIPIVQVDASNLEILWPSVLFTIKNASFIAIDLELSGIGNRRQINAKDIQERYKGLKEAAQSRAVLSLGIAAFTLVRKSKKHARLKYNANVFNISVIPSGEFTVETEALNFLIDHGFQLNDHVKHAVPYSPPKCNDSGKQKSLIHPINTIVNEILNCKKPVVFHNAFLDLAFLEHNFNCPLPNDLTSFLSRMQKVHTGGVFDTKYLADYCLHWKKSYLEYCFRKCQRENSTSADNNQLYLSVQFDSSDTLRAHTTTSAYSLPLGNYEQRLASDNTSLCNKYSLHGFCHRKDCRENHHIDLVLDQEEQQKYKKRMKRKRRENGEFVPEQQTASQNGSAPADGAVENGSAQYSKRLTGSHRAGFDAFCTGFTMAYMCKYDLASNHTFKQDYANKVALAGKAFPLILQSTLF